MSHQCLWQLPNIASINCLSVCWSLLNNDRETTLFPPMLHDPAVPLQSELSSTTCNWKINSFTESVDKINGLMPDLQGYTSMPRLDPVGNVRLNWETAQHGLVAGGLLGKLWFPPVSTAAATWLYFFFFALPVLNVDKTKLVNVFVFVNIDRYRYK